MKRLLIISLLLLSTIIKAQISCEQLTKNLHIKADSLLSEGPLINKYREVGKIEESESIFEIRYYNSPSLIKRGDVTIIFCQHGNLTAKKINYWLSPNKSYNNSDISKIETIELVPTHSWQSFLDSLIHMNFFEFPTMAEVRPKMKKYIQLANGEKVEMMSTVSDGANYTYQIKLGDSIRMFSYHSPLAWYREYSNVQELKIAEDIKNHFINGLKEK